MAGNVSNLDNQLKTFLTRGKRRRKRTDIVDYQPVKRANLPKTYRPRKQGPIY